MTPVYQTSTYVQDSPSKHKGYAYARGANPTRNALQKSIAALENAAYGLCFSSGMGATDAVIRLLKPGDEVITSNDLYGGTYRLFKRVYEKFGIKFHFIDLTDIANALPLVNANTRLMWIETPSNPLMRIIDITACTTLCKKHNMISVVDNTFASPYLQNPLDLGADIVMHSVTKYLGGHSDVVMGALALNDEKLYTDLHFLMNSCGAVPGPQDCFWYCVELKRFICAWSVIAQMVKQLPIFCAIILRLERSSGPALRIIPITLLLQNKCATSEVCFLSH